MISKYLIQASSNDDALAVMGYYTLSGANTLESANSILKEFIESANYSKSIYNKHFRVIKQTEWKKAIIENNHKLFRKDLTK
jgi:hypothetical protein